VSRNELPEKSPEGIDDQTWFYLHETLRKYDSALNRLDTDVSSIQNAEEGSANPAPVVGYCAGMAGDLVATGAVSYGPLTWGPAGGGHISAVTASYPAGVVALSYVTPSSGSYQPGELVKHLVTTATFGNPAGSPAGDDVYFYCFTAMPLGGTGWETEAIRVRWTAAMAGVAGSSTMTAELWVSDGTTSVTKTHVLSELLGSIGALHAYGANDLVLTREDLAPIGSWSSDVPVTVRVGFSTNSTSATSSSFSVGKIQLNWK